MHRVNNALQRDPGNLCPIAHDLNEVMILLFPFPPAQDFSTQTSSLEGMSNVC